MTFVSSSGSDLSSYLGPFWPNFDPPLTWIALYLICQAQAHFVIPFFSIGRFAPILAFIVVYKVSRVN